MFPLLLPYPPYSHPQRCFRPIKAFDLAPPAIRFYSDSIFRIVKAFYFRISEPVRAVDDFGHESVGALYVDRD